MMLDGINDMPGKRLNSYSIKKTAIEETDYLSISY